MKWLAVFVAVLAVASAENDAEKQQSINRLLNKVTEPIRSYFTDLKEAADSWDPMNSNSNDGHAAVKILLKEIEDGRALPRKEIFSLFYDHQHEEAVWLVDALMACEDFKCFKNNAAYFRERMNEGVFVYALYVAVSHSPLTKNVVLPPLYEITPHMFCNTEVIQKAISAKMTQTPGKFRMSFTGSKKNPEQRVAYFGEDIGMNSHHVHWHMDFPFWWNGYQIDRKGELFFWAHHQLAARYDAERLSNYLDPVDELYWTKPIKEGFAPHTTYRFGGEFPNRPDNKKFEDVIFYESVVRVRDMIITESRIIDAIDHGYIVDADGKQIDLDVDNGIDILGNIIESSTYSPNPQYYGALHNNAHILLGRQSDPKGKFNMKPGVMEHFETATRDPAFFRLHKYMDGIFKQYKDSLPPYTPDELSYSNAKITSLTVDGELSTYFEDFEIDLLNALDDTETIDDVEIKAVVPRLNHKSFSINIGVDANAAETAAFRVYMCPKHDSNGIEYTLDEARWGCILVDKFFKDLSAGSNTVSRTSAESTVVIPDRPAFATLVKAADDAVASGGSVGIDNVRGCGQPQRLLLPKGNKEGLDFELFVSVTSGQDAAVDNVKEVESYGYCGLKGEKYPDKRAMGYPLDRKVEDDRLFRIPNIKWTTVKLFHNEE